MLHSTRKQSEQSKLSSMIFPDRSASLVSMPSNWHDASLSEQWFALAHNGNIFDFPIFFAEIQSASSRISLEPCSKTPTNEPSSLGAHACVDSLSFFRSMYRILNEESGDQRSTTKDDLSYQTHESSLETNSATIHRGYVEIPLKSNVIQPAASMKLASIYEREFNQASPWKSHRAEDDCLMLLALLKLYLPDWSLWMDDHQRPLNHFASLPLKSTANLPAKTEKKIKRPFRFWAKLFSREVPSFSARHSLCSVWHALMAKKSKLSSKYEREHIFLTSRCGKHRPPMRFFFLPLLCRQAFCCHCCRGFFFPTFCWFFLFLPTSSSSNEMKSSTHSFTFRLKF